MAGNGQAGGPGRRQCRVVAVMVVCWPDRHAAHGHREWAAAVSSLAAAGRGSEAVAGKRAGARSSRLGRQWMRHFGMAGVGGRAGEMYEGHDVGGVRCRGHRHGMHSWPVA